MNLLRSLLSTTIKPSLKLRSYSIVPEVTNVAANKVESIAVTKQEQPPEPDRLYKVVELELKGNDKAVLASYLKFAQMTGKHLNLETKTWSLLKPTHTRFTMYKSVHIFKKHKAQYEFRTYYSFVQYKHLTGSTADTVLEYLQRNLPEGVACKTTKVELQPFPDHLLDS